MSLKPVSLDRLPDVLLKESKWIKMFFGDGQALLSFSHLNKDDEGLYTLRIDPFIRCLLFCIWQYCIFT